MSSIQIGALLYFTAIAIGAWIFFGVIFLQLKRFSTMSCYVPTVSKIFTIILIALTILGYIMVFMPDFSSDTTNPPETETLRSSGYFDTY